MCELCYGLKQSPRSMHVSFTSGDVKYCSVDSDVQHPPFLLLERVLHVILKAKTQFTLSRRSVQPLRIYVKKCGKAVIMTYLFETRSEHLMLNFRGGGVGALKWPHFPTITAPWTSSGHMLLIVLGRAGGALQFTSVPLSSFESVRTQRVHAWLPPPLPCSSDRQYQRLCPASSLWRFAVE